MDLIRLGMIKESIIEHGLKGLARFDDVDYIGRGQFATVYGVGNIAIKVQPLDDYAYKTRRGRSGTPAGLSEYQKLSHEAKKQHIHIAEVRDFVVEKKIRVLIKPPKTLTCLTRLCRA